MVWPIYFAGRTVTTSVSGNYLDTIQNVFSIFADCYLLLLPFVVKGFMRDRLLDSMVGFLLLGSFSVIVSPWFSVLGYQRWEILFVFPFCVYAAKGFERFHLFSKRRIKTLTAVVLIFLVIGVSYSTGIFSTVVLNNIQVPNNNKVPSNNNQFPNNLIQFSIRIFTNDWVPGSLVDSSIGWNQINNVEEALKWLDGNAMANSSVLTEESFYGWTLIYLKRANTDVKVIVYAAGSPPTSALKEALNGRFSRIYLIWYTNSSLNLKDFEVAYAYNTITIFQYMG
jgi:hypothetical protein